MTDDEARARLYDFLLDYLESRQHFVRAGARVDPRDEAALVVASITPSGRSGQGTNVLFYCASALEPGAAPVTVWVEDCVRAARSERPDEVAQLGALHVSCLRANRPGLVP